MFKFNIFTSIKSPSSIIPLSGTRGTITEPRKKPPPLWAESRSAQRKLCLPSYASVMHLCVFDGFPELSSCPRGASDHPLSGDEPTGQRKDFIQPKRTSELSKAKKQRSKVFKASPLGAPERTRSASRGMGLFLKPIPSLWTSSLSSSLNSITI